MSLSEAVGPELPLLRRYARALTGSQRLGESTVRWTRHHRPNDELLL